MEVLRGLSEGQSRVVGGVSQFTKAGQSGHCAVSGAGTSGPPSAECQSPVHRTCS